jgi:hypothetical protein
VYATSRGNADGLVSMLQTADGSDPANLAVPGAGNMPLGNRFQQLCGYVTQEDTFSPNLTGNQPSNVRFRCLGLRKKI